MVFAAGLGTRLKPLTDSMPKALVPVCGEPLLHHVLRKLVAAGYDDIVVNVHHFAGQIRDYLATHDFGARISISDETDLLRETGGGIMHARTFLEDSEWGWTTDGSGADKALRGERFGKSPFEPLSAPELHNPDAPQPHSEPFLVHNVDIISDLDLRWFREQWRPGALATLLVSERQTQRYLLFDDGMRLVGWTNIATGEVKSPYPGLQADAFRKFAFAGIHNISPAIFDVFRQEHCPERFPIIDFYLKVCAEHPIYGAAPEKLTLVDVGKFDTLGEAGRLCASIL